VSQLLEVIFRGRRHSGPLDLEAVEMATRAAMHRAGAAVLGELLSSSETAPRCRGSATIRVGPLSANSSKIPVCVVLDRIRSVYNVGAFFRTGDAAGIEKLYLCGYTGYPPHRGIAKTALGAEETLPWEHHDRITPLLAELRAKGYQIVAVEDAPDAVDLYDWRPQFPLCAVFGNEIEGVSAETLAACDVRVKIPMAGVKDSLNVAVAGGAALFELVRKRRVEIDRGRGGGR
jgi:tRNA G18 (ribose-2'-O)-methylase SpoU